MTPAWGAPAGALQVPGNPILQDNPALNTAYQNTYGRPILVTCAVGVICVPGDNGHIYLESNDPTFSVFDELDFIPIRDLLTGTALAGSTGGGGRLKGIVRPGWFYNFSTTIINGAPTFITVTAPLPARSITLL